MDALDGTFLLGYVLAVARVTRLVNRDTITEPLRIFMLKRKPGVAYFLTCPWCVSVWVAALLGALVWWRTQLDPYLIALIGAGASYLTGLAAQLDTEDIEISVEDEQ